jgi:hypothetical protein
MTKALCLASVAPVVLAVLACGSAAPDPRYPAREAGCPVKSFPGAPPMPVDELGTVTVDCSHANLGGCERSALDVVCQRGGDVAWALADNSLTAPRLVVHAAHTRRALQGPAKRGCAVRVFRDAPPMATENVGAVTALCSPDDSNESCLRELEDQVCVLGGDVVWQVDGPTPEATSEGNKLRMRGRAAHTK